MARDQQALATLRDYLAEGRFRDQQRLPPERELAALLGLSRSQLRDGLGRLESEGKIWRHVGRGTYYGVRPIETPPDLEAIGSLTNPREVMEARLAIEPLLARLAALRGTAQDFARMEDCLRRGGTPGDIANFRRWDMKLHRVIAEAARNSLLLALFDWVHANRHREFWGRLGEQFLNRAAIERHTRYHAGFVRAIRERDARRAEAQMREHLEIVTNLIFGGI